MSSSIISYTSGDDAQVQFEGSGWLAQTFTVGASNIIVSSALVYIRTYLSGSDTGYMYIKATDVDGKPTGSVLAYAAVVWPTGWGVYSWKEGTFATPVVLTASTKYALIITRNLTAGLIYWRYDNTSATYDGGQRITSSNGGTSWTVDENSTDFLFDIWGTEGGSSYVEISGGITGTSSLSGALVTSDRLNPPAQTYWYDDGAGTSFYYRLWIQSDGSYGNSPADGGTENVDYEVLAGYLPNFINTNRRLVAATRNSIYYENI